MDTAPLISEEGLRRWDDLDTFFSCRTEFPKLGEVYLYLDFMKGESTDFELLKDVIKGKLYRLDGQGKLRILRSMSGGVYYAL